MLESPPSFPDPIHGSHIIASHGSCLYMDTSTNLTPTTSTTTSSTRRRPSARFESAAAAAPRTSRGLRVDQYSRANSGVWYYQIDIEFRRVVDVTASSSTGLEPCAEDDVQYYAVKRRYNEFLQLYESIKIELAHVCEIKGYVGANDQLPPFPQKELISSSMLGLLWRMTSPMDVLEDRRVKFETLLRWIEAHPQLRECIAFTEFLGQPPQSSEGYVSLKEYSSQHWLSSLEQLTKAKAKRRRLSSDCSSCSVLQQERTRSAKKRRQDDRRGGNPSPSTSPTSRPKRRRLFAEVKRHAVVITTSPRKAKKRARASSTSSSSPHKDELSSTTHQLCLPCVDADGERVAQVESSQVHKKKKIH